MRKQKRGRPHLKTPELLAPAGNVEAFFAAIEAGADAIYLSPKILNARAFGRNFSIGQIADLVETAHKRDVKVLVALNSLMKEEEISPCMRLLAQLEEIGADALIVQDLGILKLARKHFPSLRLHASTLMTIHNSLGVEACRRLGFKRVVLARELTLSEIRQIARSASIEVEVFIHGAMCFSISGLCKFSSFFGGKSSTRGRCVQPCRRLYKWHGAKGTFFSMDDLCALEFVPDLMSAGVSSLKIEGRLKPAGYVYQVVKAYRQVLDADKDELPEKVASSMEMVKEAMGRPLSRGFLTSPNPKDLVCPTRTANTGTFLGKIQDVRKEVLRISSPHLPSAGDRIRIVIRQKDQQFSARVEAVLKDGRIRLRHGEVPIHIKEKDLAGALIFKSDSAVLSTHAAWSKIRLEKAGKEKALKRAALYGEKLASMQIQKDCPRSGSGSGPEVYVFLNDLGEIKAAPRQRYIRGVILPLSRKNLNAARRLSRNNPLRKMIVWHLPPILWEREALQVKKLVAEAKNLDFKRFQISNLAHIALPFKGARITSSFELNVLNSQAALLLRELGVARVQFSVETDLKNLQAAMERTSTKPSITVYGFIPLFTTRLRHRTYTSKSDPTSPKGESFKWKSEKGLGFLYSKVPVSFLDLGRELLSAGVTTWILDLRFFPGKRKRNMHFPSSWKGLKARFRGRSFNLRSGLQ